MLRALLTALLRINQRRRRAKNQHQRRKLLESLEDRRLLAVDAIQAFDDVAPGIFSFQTNSITNDNQLLLAVRTPHGGSVADISLLNGDGSAVVQSYEDVPTDAAGVARITTPTLPDGNYLVRARAGLYAKYFLICDAGLFAYQAEGSLSFTIDATRPIATITSAATSPTNSATIPFNISFSEPVAGLTAADLRVTNGTADRLVANAAIPGSVGSSVYTAYITPTGDGPIRVRVPENIASDSADNGNTFDAEIVISDRTPPQAVSFARTGAAITNADTLTFRVLFSEAVSNVDATDFVAAGTSAAVTNVERLSPSRFNVSISGGNLANLQGTAGMNLRGTSDVLDAAGNAINVAEPTVDEEYTVDNSRPVPQISTTATTPTNAASIPVVVTFSEPVAGFALSDVVVTNGTASGFVAGSPTQSASSFTFNVAPTTDGLVTIRIPGAIAQDAAGNANSVAIPLTFISDRTPPRPTIATTSPSPTNAAAIPFTITFSEPIVGFTLADLAITNGSASGLTGSGANYAFNVAPTADGIISVRLLAATVNDVAGNANLAGAAVAVVSDRTRPTPALSTAATSPTNAAAIPFRVVFSQPVTGFSLADLVVTNGTASGLTGSGTTFAFRVTPTADGPVSVQIATDAARDAAGNDTNPSNVELIVSDRTRPAPTLATTVPSTTNASLIPFTLTFDEAVDGLTIADLVVNNGRASGLSGGGTRYTFDVTPTADGPLSVRLPAGLTLDEAGNSNSASGRADLIVDRTPPTPTLATTSADPTAAASILFTITFSEPVDGLSLADFVVTNGTPSGLSGSDTSYSFKVAPTADGAVNVRLPAKKVQDPAGNNNTASNVISLTSDRTAPVPTVATTSASPTRAASIPFTIAFSEAVTGFKLSDLVVTNGTPSGLTGSDANYAFDIAPTADGPITVRLPAALTQDDAGNDNAISNTVTVISERTRPTPTLATTAGPLTNAASIPFTVTFSKIVTGFSLSDLVVTNGTPSKLTGSGANYAFRIAPVADGIVTVALPAATVQDAVGNANFAATPISLLSDRTSPAPTLITSVSSPTNSPSILFTVNFSESVTDFDLADVAITNGTANGLAGTGKNYTFNVTPAADGVVTVRLPAGGAKDRAGNTNLSAAPVSVTSDRTRPAPILSTTAPAFTNAPTIPFTLDFGESVTGFTLANVVITNGSPSGLSGSGKKYTFNVTPNADGVVTVRLPAGGARDGAGNTNLAATPVSITSDRTRPAPVLATTSPPFTNAPSIPFTVTFGETVSGFDLTDLTITNGTPSGLTGSGGNYSFTITPIGDGVVTVRLPAGGAQDPAGNTNLAAALVSVTSDRTRPLPTIATATASPTNSLSIPFTVTFSEDVLNFTLADIVVVNGTPSGLAGSKADYTFDITPTADGIVSVRVPGGGVQDQAGNTNLPATPVSITSDRTRPAPVISTNLPAFTNSGSLQFSVDFGDTVTGFALTDLAVTNGTAGGLSGSGANYSFRITPTADGLVTVALPAGGAQDDAGNTNLAATPRSVTVDRTAPAPVLATTSPAVTNAASIPFTVAFGETVSVFDLTDLTITNGTPSGLAGSGGDYSFSITPIGDGLVTVSLAASIAQDAAGNGNAAAAPVSVTSDRTRPVPTIATATASPTNLPSIPFTVTFSEDVANFTLSDIVVVNGTPSSLTGSKKDYTFTVTPAADGVVSVRVPGGGAIDAAGNTNVAATPFNFTSDRTSPMPVFATTSPAVTNAASIPFTVDFGETVNSFALTDLSITNGTPSNLKGSGASYSFDVTPLADGLVTVNLGANIRQDLAGNNNLAAVPVSVTSDRTGPTPIVSSASSSPTNAPSIDFTVDFGESVNGFSLAGINASNGTPGGLTGSGAIYSFRVTPLADGPVTVTIPGAVAQDSSGNVNKASAPFSIVSERFAPTLTIVSDVGTTTNALPIPITITFSETVTGFTVSDINVSVGSVNNFAGSGAVYTFDLVALPQGPIDITVAGGAAFDIIGNTNALTTATVVRDSVSPAPTITPGVVSPTNAAAIPFTLSFNEPVTGLTLADLVIGNGTPGNLAGNGANYTFDVTPTADGSVTVDLPAGAAQDGAGNDSSAATQASVVSDRSVPDVTITTGSPSPTNSGFITFTATFTEPVTGLTFAEVSVTNGTVADISDNGTVYNIVISPAGNGPVVVSLAAGVAQDAAGNDNTPGAPVSVISDRAAPLGVLNYIPPTPALGNLGVVNINFNETVTGLQFTDFTLTRDGTTLLLTPAMLTGSGSSYVLDLSSLPRIQGNYTLTLNAASSNTHDLAGNSLQADLTTSWTETVP